MNSLVFILFVAIFVNDNQAQIKFPGQEYRKLLGKNCATPNQEQGECTAFKQCSYLFNLNLNPQKTPQEREFLSKSLQACGYENGRIVVCCLTNNPTITPIETIRPANTATALLTSKDEASLLPQPGICGSSDTNKIFGGNKTTINDSPWTALLEYKKVDDNTKKYGCGGSLINNRYVITAAHCIVFKKSPIKWHLINVRLGEWDINTPLDCEKEVTGSEKCSDPPVDVSIEKTIVHENYNKDEKSNYNDIALIRLSKPVQYSTWISPICLPLSNNLRNSNFNGITLEVTGWGRTESGFSSPIKLNAKISVRSQSFCNDAFAKHNVVLRDGQMCAGGEKGIDSCKGDSGGPLVGIDNTNKQRANYFLAGIVSFGQRFCGSEGKPGAYTRVGKYVDWIVNNIAP